MRTRTIICRRSKRNGRHSCGRTGATMVESAIVLGVLMFLILGIFQLGISALRANVVSDAARRLAREAAVHGDMAAPERSVWGPGSDTGNAADGSDYAAVLLPVLPTIDPAELVYEIDWIDGETSPESRVQVRISFTESPIVPFVDWLVPSDFSATSTIQIAH